MTVSDPGRCGNPRAQVPLQRAPVWLTKSGNTVVRKYLASGSLEAEPDAGILQSSVQRVLLERGSRENIEPREKVSEGVILAEG